jgi:Ala-tRNA(Pro) deacylase
MNGDPNLYRFLENLKIEFQYLEHPPAPTIEIAKQYWEGHEATHCKNIFMRNHKGNQHYLVLLPCDSNLAIRDLEQRLKQGKLTFASEERLMKHLKLTPGSVTPFGLINDEANHVIVFIDEQIQQSEYVSFHPNLNTASLIIRTSEFIRYMNAVGNTYHFINLSTQ